MQAMLRRWWWVPVVLLGMLLLKAWLVGDMVQSDARALAADAAGIDETRVEMVDGLNVRLTGFADEESRDAAVAAVEDLDSSWEVVGLVGSGDAGRAGDGAIDTADVELDIAANGEVVIRGTVADEARRSVIVAEIEDRAGSENVTDELVVDSALVAPSGGRLTVMGEANNERQRNAWVDGSSAAALAAGLDFVDLTTVASTGDDPADGDTAADDPADGDTTGDDPAEGDTADGAGEAGDAGDASDDAATDAAVEDALNDLFDLEPIEFDYNAATIRPESIPTLDRAASTIDANPGAGPFRIVGHTDSDGNADDNLRLSQARADAVVAHLVDVGGVDPSLLVAEGRGETELRVDPERTSNDKQRNRRIAWERVE